MVPAPPSEKNKTLGSGLSTALCTHLVERLRCPMSALGHRRKSRSFAMMSAFPLNLLQNYFGPQSGEHFSKSSPEQGILIQEIALPDSIIAHFRWSTAHWPSFATDSPNSGSHNGPTKSTLSAINRHCRAADDLSKLFQRIASALPVRNYAAHGQPGKVGGSSQLTGQWAASQ